MKGRVLARFACGSMLGSALGSASVLGAASVLVPGCVVGGEEPPGCRADHPDDCEPGFVCRAGACLRFTTDSSTPNDPSDSGTPNDPSDSGTPNDPPDSGTPNDPPDSGTPNDPPDSGTTDAGGG